MSGRVWGKSARFASGRTGSVGVRILGVEYLVLACPLTITVAVNCKASPGSYLVTWFQVHGTVMGTPPFPRPTLIVGTEPVDPAWLAREMGFLHGTAREMAEAITDLLKTLREGTIV